MLKKIRDLNVEEIYAICKKNANKPCSDCPLYLGEDSDYADVCLRFDYGKFVRALEIADKEMEVGL